MLLYFVVCRSTVVKGYALPIDCISFAILLWNFAAVGVCAIFWRTPLRIKQAYLCAASVIMARPRRRALRAFRRSLPTLALMLAPTCRRTACCSALPTEY